MSHRRRPWNWRRTLPRLAAAAVLTLVVLAAPLRARGEAYQVLSPDQVQKLLGAKDVRIIDANSQEIFEKHHLPGAVHIGMRPLEDLLPADKAVRLVFYCTSPG